MLPLPEGQQRPRYLAPPSCLGTSAASSNATSTVQHSARAPAAGSCRVVCGIIHMGPTDSPRRLFLGFPPDGPALSLQEPQKTRRNDQSHRQVKGVKLPRELFLLALLGHKHPQQRRVDGLHFRLGCHLEAFCRGAAACRTPKPHAPMHGAKRLSGCAAVNNVARCNLLLAQGFVRMPSAELSSSKVAAAVSRFLDWRAEEGFVCAAP